MGSDDEEKIIRPEFGEAPVVIDHAEPGPACSHYYIKIRQNERTVVCRSCGREVDPLDVLTRLARQWASATYLESELARRETNVEVLREEEARLKARIRNSKKALGPSMIDAHYDEVVARLSRVRTHQDLYALDRWRQSFNWFTPQQNAALQEAKVHARRRIEDHERKGRARKRVRVIKGGKQ